MRGFARSVLALVALAAASGALMAQTAPDYPAVLNAPDRTDADRKNDERRAPLKILAIAGVQPGWTVLDMGAGAGGTAPS
jgi:predicted methyltransferase